MQKHADYVPLHLHTEYSLLDGAIKIPELIETAAKWRLPAVAVTDHGNLFGAIEFYKKASKGGIKPVIGSEVYLTPGSRLDRQKEEGLFHLILLARDNAGYKNLVYLVSRAYTEGFYYKPRIDKELLEKYSGGLIALSACMKGEVAWHLSRDMADKAKSAALYYKNLFGPDNFFMELQENGIPEQAALNKKLLSLARELDIKVVATNDCHYLHKEDARAHDILICIQTGKTVKDADRMRFQGDGLYFKSPEEMIQAFVDLPEAIRNTIEIAERCNVDFKLGSPHLPKFQPPGGLTAGKMLEDLVTKGLKERFGAAPIPELYIKRMEHEEAVIKRMGYESYFLIVWDFINQAKEKGIPVGPGRGSAAGSLVSWALRITEIDPIRNGLLFERFLNPERISMPDIDVDFCKDRRQEIITYVAEKYGQDHVAQIITFGTLGAKAAIRDVGRALDIPYAEVDKIAKLVPETLNITIKDALKMEPRLSELYENDAVVKELIDIAQRLEGLARHASTHAAGVVIAPEPIMKFAPLYKNPTDGTITTQFDMGSIESLGLIKFDLLGLKTLTVLEKTVRFIRENGKEFSLKDIKLDDKETYELLASGQSTGIFQFESGGMREILVKLVPERFEDLVALNALYRPGPLGSGMVDEFINGKRGRTLVKYDLPELKDILSETYGVILYQEQVMEIAHRLAGFTLGQADILRKAMGKKLPEEMEKQKEAFIKGAKAHGTPEGKAKKLFDLMAKFAEYGFNKSHSAAYAYVAFQTAYLKAHYPVEFMAANMSVELDNTDKIMKFIKECQLMNIKVLPPDINVSDHEFKVVGDSIRFGLGAVKGAGAQAIESIIEARGEGGRFSTFRDFLDRINKKKVNKKVLEALVKAGAFDSVGASRRASFMLIENPRRSSGQSALFGGAEETAAGLEEEWEPSELLAHEKEALGFYISGHPLRKFKHAIAISGALTSTGFAVLEDKAEVGVAGVLSAIRRIKTKQDKGMMAQITLEDDEGVIEAVVFPDLYKEKAELLKRDTPLLVRGSVDRTDKGPKLIARSINHLEDFLKNGNANGKKLEITACEGIDLAALKKFVDEHKGNVPVILSLFTDGLRVIIDTPFKVAYGEEFQESLGQALAHGSEKGKAEARFV
jgi:DNA polymerase-3 subunit alpha